MNLIVGGTEYTFTTAPRFVVYGTRLLGEMFGANMSAAPKWAHHRALLWSRRYGAPA